MRGDITIDTGLHFQFTSVEQMVSLSLFGFLSTALSFADEVLKGVQSLTNLFYKDYY
jgi:hypothetical protein